MKRWFLIFAACCAFCVAAKGQAPTAPILYSDGTFTTCLPTSCVNSSAAWMNIALPAVQTGAFRLEFDATPSLASVDSVVGLAGMNVTDYPNLAVIIRFNSAGKIDARNGANYIASTIPYTAGTKYHFILDVYIASRTYNASVNGQVIGGGMAFRSEQAGITSLKNLAAETSPGSVSICNPKISAAGTQILPLVLVTTSIPTAKYGVAYSTILAASGGKIPYVWAATGLPTGILLSANGVLAGMPTVSASASNFSVTVTDALGTRLSESLGFVVAPPIVAAHAATLSWNASAGAMGYNVYRGGTLISSVHGTAFVDLTVKAGTSYCYLVTATAGNFQSANSSEVCVLVPTP